MSLTIQQRKKLQQAKKIFEERNTSKAEESFKIGNLLTTALKKIKIKII